MVAIDEGEGALLGAAVSIKMFDLEYLSSIVNGRMM